MSALLRRDWHLMVSVYLGCKILLSIHYLQYIGVNSLITYCVDRLVVSILHYDHFKSIKILLLAEMIVILFKINCDGS